MKSIFELSGKDAQTHRDISLLLAFLRDRFKIVLWLVNEDAKPATQMSGDTLSLLLAALPTSMPATYENVRKLLREVRDWPTVGVVVMPQQWGDLPDDLSELVDHIVACGARPIEYENSGDESHLIRRFAALGV